jgi:hypothetical protein
MFSILSARHKDIPTLEKKYMFGRSVLNPSIQTMIHSCETVPLISPYSCYVFGLVPFKLGKINKDEREYRTQFSSRTENFLDFPRITTVVLFCSNPPPLSALTTPFLSLSQSPYATPYFLGCYEREWSQVRRQQKSVDLFHCIPPEALCLRGLRVNNGYPNICIE